MAAQLGNDLFLLILRWRYSPMRAFVYLLDLSQLLLFFDLLSNL